MASNVEGKFQYLMETKELIRAAITEKGQTVSASDPFRSYAEKIAAIAVGGGDTGGGGGNMMFKSKTMNAGTFTPSNGVLTVNHEMGVVPDIVIFMLASVPTGNAYIMLAYGYSAKMLAALGGGYIASMEVVSTAGHMSFGSNGGIEYDAIDSLRGACIRNATASTFQVGNSSYPALATNAYKWIAIANIV